MELNDNEYRIIGLNSQEESCEGIFISKKALEKWKDHYIEVATKCLDKKPVNQNHYDVYFGMVAVLIDILKHFEEGGIDMTDIEKRAWEKYPEVIKHHNLAQIDINEEKRKMYIEIAAKQKFIDDANTIRLIQEQKELSLALIEKQKVIDIDKAWNYFKDMIESWCLEVGAEPNVYLPQEEDKYRKAMEE